MKYLYVIIIVFSACVTGYSQNDEFFGHYMFNPSYFNPGWGGGEETAFVAFQHRSQWLAYSTSFDGDGGAPSTQLLTAIVPFKNFFLSAVGLNVSNETLGSLHIIKAQFPIAYRFSVSNYKVNIGIAPSMVSMSLSNNLRFNEIGDPVGQAAGQQSIQPNLGAGILLSKGRLFYGVGASNLLRPSLDFGVQGLENVQEINIIGHAGYNFDVSSNVNIAPSILVRTDWDHLSFDIGAIVSIGQQYWTGLSYRRSESLTLFIGSGLLEDDQLKIGGSFEYIVEDREAKAATSVEVFVKYDLPNLVFGGRKNIKTPRFY